MRCVGLEEVFNLDSCNILGLTIGFINTMLDMQKQETYIDIIIMYH